MPLLAFPGFSSQIKLLELESLPSPQHMNIFMSLAMYGLGAYLNQISYLWVFHVVDPT